MSKLTDAIESYKVAKTPEEARACIVAILQADLEYFASSSDGGLHDSGSITGYRYAIQTVETFE